MSREVTIAILARDNFSDSVTKMRNAGIHFNKNLEEMQAQLKAINKTRSVVGLDIKDAQKNLKALQKEIEEAKKTSKDGIISEELMQRYQDANEELALMRQNMGLLDKAAKDTGKSMNSASGIFSKLESKAGGKNATGGLMTALAASGLADMAKELASSASNAWVKSMHGSEVATVFSSALSGAASGAAAGTMLGAALPPGVGTAAGAAAGTVVGLTSGALTVAGQKDDVFRGVVQDQYNGIMERWQNDLADGSTIAGQREMDNIAFSKLLGGKEESAEYLNWVKDTANATPFQYDDLKSMSKVLATYKFSTGEMQDALLKIGDAGASLGLSSQDMGMVATGLGRMKSSGKTSLEYINLLQERGIDAVGMLGDFYGMDNGQVYDAISKGELDGGRSTKIILKYLEEYKGAMDEQSKTFLGLTSTQQGLEQEMQAAMGEGFNKEREKGIAEQNAFLDPESETGKSMIEAKRLMGEYQASLKNEEERTWREAITSAMELDEYKAAAAAGDGAKMGEILAEAEANAITAYHETQTYKDYEISQKSIVNRLQSALADDYEHFGYEMGKEFTKGIEAAAGQKNIERALGITERFKSGEVTREDIRAFNPGFTDRQVEEAFNAQTKGNSVYEEKPPGAAYGLSYIPRDNYPVRLHEGERVLTASEARAYGSGGGNITVNINGEFNVREEDDIDRIASELARRLREVQMLS